MDTTYDGSLKPRVLIVDDDTVNGVVLENYFSEYDTTVEQHAHRVFELASEGEFHVVLMDIHLSDENYSGIVLMKELRKLRKYKDALFVAVTGYAMESDKKAILNSGFDAYFSKPVDKSEILPKVKSLLKEKVGQK